MSYATELTTKKYVGNVIVRFLSTYFSIRQPDSGLTVGSTYNGLVSSLNLSGVKIDPRVVQTATASYGFNLLDKNNVITALIKEYAQDVIGEEIEIWIGRTGVSMPFSDYFKLPITKIRKIEKSENAYSFTTAEDSERLNRPVYDAKTRVSVDILSGTTIITGLDAIDSFPSAGLIKIEDEYFSYTTKNNTTKTFTGVVRGELGSTPAAYEQFTDMFLAENITDNPLDILISLLVSSGGGSSYDTLDDGAGFANAMVDIAGIEAIRDEHYSGVQFELTFSNIASLLDFIEDEILLPCNLRLNYNSTSKLGIVRLDQPIFVDPINRMNEDTITSYPKWMVDENKIVNELEINWDYDEGTNEFSQRSVFVNSQSQTDYGRRTPLAMSFKGVRSALSGSTFINDFGTNLLYRLGNPVVQIDFNGHIDKHLLNPGDITILQSTQVPRYNGTLGFDSEIEILSRSIDHIKGDVKWSLGFTAFSVIRNGYIAPSSFIVSVASQSQFTITTGHGVRYAVGYKLRLFNKVTPAYESDSVRTITNISGDVITVDSNFTTTLIAGTTHKIKFADYDQSVTSEQFRYCFISDGGANFGDGERTYAITK